MTRWCCATLLALAAAPLAAAEAAVPKELKQASADYAAALRTRNGKQLDRLLAEDFQSIDQSGRVSDRKAILRGRTAKGVKFASLATSEVKFRVYGDLAVETGRVMAVVLDSSGGRTSNDLRYTAVWVKKGGRWRLVAEHLS